MGVLFLLIFLVISVMIVGLVLLQEGKGGGLTGMSAGMDGVMGAKNPLRRLTAYLFVAFVFLTISINWYFHQRADTVLPAGAVIPAPPSRIVEETNAIGPAVGTEVVPEGALRPEPAGETAPAAPLRPGPGQMELPAAPLGTTVVPAPAPAPQAVPPLAAEPDTDSFLDLEKAMRMLEAESGE